MKRLLFVVCLAACGNSDAPCGDAGSCTTSGDAPRILTIGTNSATLEPDDTLVVTAIVTDPQGVDDLIGGQLVDPDTMASYGAFATSAAEGAYELRVPWDDINLVRSIDTPTGGSPRMFVARFFDVAGHTAEQTVAVSLHCSDSASALCKGSCTDLMSDANNCGMCGVKLPAGTECHGGQAGCAMGPENTTAACTDGCSNDSDAYIDCNDYNCCSVVTCPTGTTCNP